MDSRNSIILHIALLTLVTCPWAVHGAYTYVRFTVTAPASVAGQYGCMPADYSASAGVGLHTPVEMVMADPPDACTELSNDVDGKIVIVNSARCYSIIKSTRAKRAGAAAVIVYRPYEGETPPPLAKAVNFIPNPGIPVCATWKHMGEAMVAALENGETVMAHMSGYRPYEPDNEPLLEHEVTPIDVLSPADVKWRYPAGQSTFNPATYGGAVAPMHVAQFIPDCQGNVNSFNLERCKRCWAADTIFSNVADVSGAVLHYAYDNLTTTSPCVYYYYELLLAAQQAGAVGVVMPARGGLPLMAPSTVPFIPTIPIFTMLTSMLDTFTPILQSQIPLVVELPALSHGSGPDYFLEENDLGSLETTRLMFSSGGSTYEVHAGQTAFNPFAHEGIANTPVVMPTVSPDCALADGPESPHGAVGVDCIACMADVQAGTAISGDVADAVALLMAEDVFCFTHWLDVARAVQSAGAAAMLVGNDDDMTWSYTSDEPGARLAMPTFNIAKSIALNMSATISNGGGAVGSRRLEGASSPLHMDIPVITNGSAPTIVPIIGALQPTQVQVLEPQELRGFWEAGQALFNPVTPSVEAPLVLGSVTNACDGTRSCFLCPLVDNPFHNNVSGAVALVPLSRTRCLHPVSNLVVLAQAQGAVGVLFVDEEERIEALGPEELGVLITIPSFVIPSSLGEQLKTAIEDQGDHPPPDLAVSVRLPFIQNQATGAPESVATNPVEEGPKTPNGSPPVIPEPGPGPASTPSPPAETPWEWIAIGIAAGSLVVGLVAGLVFHRWRRVRRLQSYHQVTQSQQTDAFGGGDVELASVVPNHQPLLGNNVGSSTFDDTAVPGLKAASHMPNEQHFSVEKDGLQRAGRILDDGGGVVGAGRPPTAVKVAADMPEPVIGRRLVPGIALEPLPVVTRDTVPPPLLYADVQLHKPQPPADVDSGMQSTGDALPYNDGVMVDAAVHAAYGDGGIDAGDGAGDGAGAGAGDCGGDGDGDGGVLGNTVNNSGNGGEGMDQTAVEPVIQRTNFDSQASGNPPSL